MMGHKPDPTIANCPKWVLQQQYTKVVFKNQLHNNKYATSQSSEPNAGFKTK